MSIVTRTFSLSLNSTSTSVVTELLHLRDMTFATDERVGVYLEGFFTALHLPGFQLGKYPDYDGDEDDAEKISKYTAAEIASQKIGLRILSRKNNTGAWKEKAEIILVNRGRKQYYDFLVPYLAKVPIRLLEANDALGVQLVDYGNGLLKTNDFIEIDCSLRVEILKKNDFATLMARISALELALEGRLINLPANSLLGRTTATGVVEVIPQSQFATPAQITNAINALTGNSSTALDTLAELGAALGNDANFAATIINALATKANLINPVFSSLLVGNTNVGGIRIQRGSTMNSGYVEVFKSDGNTRLGYIGFDNFNLTYQAENNANHVFGGGKVILNNFTTLGDNVAIKVKRITGTTAASQNANVQLPHGITPSKIISFHTIVNYIAGGFMPPGLTYFAGYQYDSYIDNSAIVVFNSANNSANITNKPVNVLIYYIE